MFNLNELGWPFIYVFSFGISDFLVKKYSFLYEFVQDDLILKAAQHFETLLSALERSFSRDYFRFEKIYALRGYPTMLVSSIFDILLSYFYSLLYFFIL